jgi:hypothetical protein
VSERTHDEFRELLGAFALDAVDEQESVEIRGHLSTCTTCAAEVDGHHEMTAMLANTGGEAPAHLWERIEAQLGTVPSRERTADSAGPPGRDDLVARRAARSARTTVLSVRLLAAAAVVALVAVLGIQVVRLENRVSGLQGANLQQQVARAAQRALADPAARHVVLDSANSTNRLAEIAVLPTGAAFLVNDALPALPRDRTYQLWGLVGTRLVSLGLLGANPTAVSFETGGGGLVSEYAITAEHAGGVVQSTHLPVAVSQA